MLDNAVSWLKKLWKSYNGFCKELGIDQGACRGCVPIVKFDEDMPKKGEIKKEEMNKNKD